MIADSRLETYYKGLQADPKLLPSVRRYCKVLTDSDTNYLHYLSYRAVVRDEHETTKVHVAFDVSVKYKGFPSLNELLGPGLCLLPHIFDILIRLRLRKVPLISDIKQAFLQIQIDTEHQVFL